MYGAKWCKYTQKLTPKWLGLQTRIRAEGLSRDINIAKVECTKYMDFCKGEGIDGFPTVYVYENGKKYEEYTGNHEINEMFTYVQEQVARFKSEEVVEEVVTVYVEEVVYEDEMEENKPRKSSKEDYQQNQQNQQTEEDQRRIQQQQQAAKGLPKKKTDNENLPPKGQPPKNNRGAKQAPKNPPPKGAPKYPPKYSPNMYQQQQQQQQYQQPPKNQYGNYYGNYGRQFPPKRSNPVVKATKKVFGIFESIVLLAIVLVVIYVVVRFKSIKNHSSYSKSKIPLYRDLTQEEKFMLHYS
jgi:Thioredoxin.